MAEIRKWKDGQGNYLWAAPSTSEQVGTILGKPIYTDDYMDGLGAGKCPVAVADWNRAYTIADRMGVSILRDPYTNKPFVQFYATKRVGGGIKDRKSHTSELQSLMRISYAVFCLKQKHENKRKRY